MTDTPLALDQLIQKASPSSLLTIGKAVAKTEQQKEQELAPIREEESAQLKKGREESDTAFQAIEPFKPTEAPEWSQFQGNPIAQFGSLGSVFGIIASAFTHAPMVNAMNAAASAINASQQSDWRNYKTAYQAWKDNMEMVFKRHEVEMADWRALVDKNRDNLANLEADARIHAAKYDDRAGVLLTESGQIRDYLQIQDARANLAARLQENAGKIKEQAEIAADITAIKQTDAYKNADPSQRAEMVKDIVRDKANLTMNDIMTQAVRDRMKTTGEDALTALVAVKKEMTKGDQLDPQTVDYLANVYNKTGQMPSFGWGQQGADMRRLVLERAAAMAVDQSPVGTWAATKADRAALDRLAILRANVGNFEATATKEADLAMNLAPKGAAGSGVPVVNRWIQAGRRDVAGDPDVVAFNAAITSFKNEYARIMSAPGATGGVTSDAARDEAESMINNAFTMPQLQNVIATMKRGMTNRISSIDEEYASTIQRLQTPAGATSTTTKTPATGAPSSGAAAPELPKAIVDQLKPGQWTTLSDGTVWTLDDSGKPQQVK